MNIRKILLMILLVIIIFSAGILTGILSNNAKVSSLRKLVKNLRQNITEANEHALVLQNSLDQIKKSVSKLESLNAELKTEAQNIEKNLHRAIDTSGTIGSGIKNASVIASESRKDIDELQTIIQRIKDKSVSEVNSAL